MRTRVIAGLIGLVLLIAVGTTPVLAQTAVGTVTASQLNVRTAPDPIDGVAIARVFEGQQFTIVGRDATANWFQIRLPDGNTGWVSSAYFRVINFSGVPVTNSDYIQGRVLSNRLNLRETPTTAARSLGQISRGQVYRVLGKTADSTWYQLRLPSGITGWVTARWLYVTDPARVPVTNSTLTSTSTSATTTIPVTVTNSGQVGVVTASQLNVRTAPDPLVGVAFTRVFQGQQFTIVGRDATASWYQILLPDGSIGWVSSAYFRVGNSAAAPVTNTGFIQGTVVNASLLNIRENPDPINGRILGQISRGQRYRVLARSTNGWYEIQLPTGVTGWVNGTYLSVSNPDGVPIR